MRKTSLIFMLLVTTASTASFADNNYLMNQTKQNVKDMLKDPESAQFRNVKIAVNTVGEKSVCGQVNAKNSYGGYTGFKSFYAKINDKIVYLEDDTNYRMAGCEGKAVELDTRQLQKENDIKRRNDYIDRRTRSICYHQEKFITDVVENYKKIDTAYDQTKIGLYHDFGLLDSYKKEEYYKEYSSSKEDFLEELNKLKSDPIKMKIIRGRDYDARYTLYSEMKENCLAKHKSIFN